MKEKEKRAIVTKKKKYKCKLTATSLENILFVCKTMALKFRTESNSNVISTGLPAKPIESLRQPTHS